MDSKHARNELQSPAVLAEASRVMIFRIHAAGDIRRIGLAVAAGILENACLFAIGHIAGIEILCRKQSPARADKFDTGMRSSDVAATVFNHVLLSVAAAIRKRLAHPGKYIRVSIR